MYDSQEASQCLTMTYRNLGVYYKQMLKIDTAIRYLKKVIEIEKQMTSSVNQAVDLAQSYINMTSIYSELEKHEIALIYAEKAIEVLEPEYEKRYPDNMGDENQKVKLASVTANMYHRAAKEYEYGQDFSTSLIMH